MQDSQTHICKLDPAAVLATDFLGEEVVQRHMNGAGRASLLRRIQAASKNDMELDHALKAYGACQSSALVANARFNSSFTMFV